MYQPKFKITSSINSKIAQIERIRTVVDQSKILPQQELVLRKRAAIEAVYSSTSIENNPLKKHEVEKVIQGKSVRSSEQAITEVKNYHKAWQWLVKRSTQKKKISEQDALNVHAVLMQNLLMSSKVGHYRPSSIYIVDGNEQLIYQGPNSADVDHLVQELLDWLLAESDLHPILKAGIFHYEFVSIHPYSDGNGRTTRILTLLTLWLEKYSFREVLVPDSYYWQHRSDYYKALRGGKTYDQQTTADLTSWLEFFTAGFLSQAEELEKQISLVEISGDIDTPIRITADQLELLDFCQQMGKITVKDVIDILSIPRRTAQRRLEELISSNLLAKESAGPSTHYIIKSN